MIAAIAPGLVKVVVPTWTAVAPAMKNSSASSSVAMPPRPMIGMSHGGGDLIDHADRERLDRGAGEAAGAVGEDGAPAAHVDRHAEQGVDQREGVGPGVGDGAGDRDDVGDVRRQLDDDRQGGHGAHGGGDLGREVGVGPEEHPARVDVGAGDVQFEPGDARALVEHRGHLGELADRVAGDVDDDRHLPAATRSADIW